MDTSFWIQYNPKIQIDHTLKKYYGKYLYKLVVYAPGSRIIDSKGDLSKELDHRISLRKDFNYGGYWGWRKDKSLENADISFIEKLKELRQDRSLNLKLRVEEPRVQIYATSDQDLQHIVKNVFNAEHCCYVETISGPEDVAAEQLLNAGAIIRKSDNGFRYKIILRDGRYSQDTKAHILEYLWQLPPDQVGIPHSCIAMLKNSSSYIWSLYFYANDPGIVTFLSLMHPNLVLNYHEMVVLPHK